MMCPLCFSHDRDYTAHVTDLKTYGPTTMIAAQTQLHIFTYKDGLLARLAHDLRLSLSGLELDQQGDQITLSVPLSTLHVDGVMRQGTLRPDELTDAQREQILKNAHEELLMSAQHELVTITGTLSRTDAHNATLTGTLTLKGQAQPIQAQAMLYDTHATPHWRGQLEVQPSQWGIPPFKAMGGAIKLKDRWTITLTLPQAALTLEEA